MPRPCKCRFVSATPRATLFKPAGVPARMLEPVALRLDELEALRLADWDGLYQEAAAERMQISRPTFARLIEVARRKVADALLHGKVLVIHGGPVMIANERTFECAACGQRFQAPRGTGRPAECPACHGRNFCRAPQERGQGLGRCRRRGQGAAAGCGNRRRFRGGRTDGRTTTTTAQSNVAKEPS